MINEQIRDKEVRLIGPDGEQLRHHVCERSVFQGQRRQIWIW